MALNTKQAHFVTRCSPEIYKPISRHRLHQKNKNKSKNRFANASRIYFLRNHLSWSRAQSSENV